MHGRRERHQSQAFREPRVSSQAVPIRCDRQVNECWVAVRDGLIKAVERFVEPACCPIQNGAKKCDLQQDAPYEPNLVEDHFGAANSACQLSTTGKGCVVVCSTGIATRNRVPSLVAFASENQAPGVRNRNWGMPGRNVAPAVT